MLLPAIDLATLLNDKEENLKPEQMNVSHVSVMELLGDPGNPLYAEPHSMAEHFDAMTTGTCAIGELPGQTHCKDNDVTARVYKDEAKQVCQKILRYLDMRVMDRDLVVLTCLQTPTLILPAGCFVVMYYDPDAQGQYTSQFPTRGQDFMQPRGDIRTSIMPRNFRVLPADVWEVVDQYFHREELERRVDLDKEASMSTDTEATETVRWLQLDSPAAAASLQVAMCEALTLATAAWLQEEEEEYYYDSHDSVLDIDEQYPKLAERVMQWQATRWDAISVPPWHQPDLGQEQRLLSDKLPDLHETINQARGARVAAQVPVQSVAPMQLPFASVRDLDHQCQLCHDQTLAKWRPSPLEAEQCKQAKMPPQPDPHDALNGGHTQTTERESRDWGHSRVRGKDRQKELNRVRARSKSQKCSKSQKRSKSRRQSKSRKRSKSRGPDEAEMCNRYEMQKPGVWSSQRRREEPSQSPSNTTKQGGQSAEQLAPCRETSNFLKLKEEVLKHAQSYIRRHALAIGHTLAPDHEAIKCLSAFGDQAQKFAAEILATIEWGTQHWKLQESFPVPLVPKWLHTLEYVQTITPMWGELPLVPLGAHYEDIRICCPAVWAWMAVLLQFWQDHMTRHLYGGHFHEASDLANTLIQDINVWMPHSTQFGWNYVATHASLWLDIRDQFAEEHLEELETQKFQAVALNDLERDTEAVYRAHVIKKRDNKACANSKEAAAQELPPEWRAAHVERQASTMPTKVDVSSTNAGVPLYPNWIVRNKTKPAGRDASRPYQVPKEDTVYGLTLEEELDVASVFDPLKPDSQSSQLDTQGCSVSDSTLGAEGLRMPPHYSEAPAMIPPFDLAQVGILPKMSPIMDRENELLNLAPGSAITRTTPPGLNQGHSRSERSSYSGSPMSLGSPAGIASLALALRVRAHLVMPVIFSSRRESPAHDVEEEMDTVEDDAKEEKDEDWRWTRLIHPTSVPCLAHRRVEPEDQMNS